MAKRNVHLILYGPEGSGKSTQAKKIADKYEIPYLGSGDLVRSAAENDKGALGETCKLVLEEGKYVADSEMFVLWKKRLKGKDINGGWIMDGFPRNISQAKFLDKKLDKYGQKVDAVIHLKVRRPESIERLLKRGRKLGNGQLHDSLDKIKERLKRYHDGEKRVLGFYKNKRLLISVDGESPVGKVYENVMRELEKHLKRREGRGKNE